MDVQPTLPQGVPELAWLESFFQAGLAGRHVYWVEGVPTLCTWSLFASKVQAPELASYLEHSFKKLEGRVPSKYAMIGMHILCARPGFYECAELRTAVERIDAEIDSLLSFDTTVLAAERYRDEQLKLESRQGLLTERWKEEGYTEFRTADGSLPILTHALKVCGDVQAIEEACARFPKAIVQIFAHYLHADRETVSVTWPDLKALLEFANAVKSLPLQTAAASALADSGTWDQRLGVIRQAQSVEPWLLQSVRDLLLSRFTEIAEHGALLRALTREDMQFLCGSDNVNGCEEDVWHLVKEWCEEHSLSLITLPIVEWVRIEYLPKQLIDREFFWSAGPGASVISEEDRRKWSEQVAGQRSHWHRRRRTRRLPQYSAVAAAPEDQIVLRDKVLAETPMTPAHRIAERVAQVLPLLTKNMTLRPDQISQLSTLVHRACWDSKVPLESINQIQRAVSNCKLRIREQEIEERCAKIRSDSVKVLQLLPSTSFCSLKLPAIQLPWLAILEGDPWGAEFMKLAPAHFRSHTDLCKRIWAERPSEHSAVCKEIFGLPSVAPTTLAAQLGFASPTDEIIEDIGPAARLLWVDAGVHRNAQPALMQRLYVDYLRQEPILRMASTKLKAELFELGRQERAAPAAWLAARACGVDEQVLKGCVSELNWKPFPESVKALFGTGGPDVHLMPVHVYEQLLAEFPVVKNAEQYPLMHLHGLQIAPTVTGLELKVGVWAKDYADSLHSHNDGIISLPIKFGPDRYLRLSIENRQVVWQYKGLTLPSDRYLCTDFWSKDEVPMVLDVPSYAETWTNLCVHTPKGFRGRSDFTLTRIPATTQWE